MVRIFYIFRSNYRSTVSIHSILLTVQPDNMQTKHIYPVANKIINDDIQRYFVSIEIMFGLDVIVVVAVMPTFHIICDAIDTLNSESEFIFENV